MTSPQYLIHGNKYIIACSMQGAKPARKPAAAGGKVCFIMLLHITLLFYTMLVNNMPVG
jgi:hypothetical protein